VAGQGWWRNHKEFEGNFELFSANQSEEIDSAVQGYNPAIEQGPAAAIVAGQSRPE
jgi:hypothetical protein